MTGSAPALLELVKVTKHFGGVTAVDGIDLTVNQGEVVGLIGPNGAGKTTVFNIVSGVMPASTGSIRFRGKEINGLRPDQITRAGIARTFQAASFLSGMTAYENVQIAAAFRRPAARRQRADRDVISDALRTTGLLEHADLPAEALNVSQHKRLEIARAIATEPELLMTDEVVAGLTPPETDEILAILMTLNRRGMTLIFVEHDVRAVLSVSQRLVVLAQGALLAQGEPQSIARSPEVIKVYLGSRYVAGH